MRRTVSKKIIKGSLLFEIGTEEMPVLALGQGIAQLKEAAKIAFMASNVPVDTNSIKVYATPRRLVLYIDKGISHKQTLVDSPILGPSLQSAYDKNGNRTLAYIGFAKKHGVKLEDVTTYKTNKGEYLRIFKKARPKSTINLLPAIIKEIINQLQFSKTMRWDDMGFRFPRPIRWLIVIYDDKIARCPYGAVKSENITFINRAPFRIKNINDYFRKIKAYGILIDADKRREYIKARIGAGRGSLMWDDKQEELLTEVTFLTERPCVFAGRFNARYSKELPKPVLFACLSKYQRLFGVSGMPRFFGVADGSFNKKTLAGIRKNYKYVLEARLKDALFFYNEDLKIKLDKRIDMLKGIVFLEGLGSIYEKTQRLKDLSGFIADRLNLSETDRQNLIRSTSLCKADLTTLMVKEFPSLQGTVGRLYAFAQGENKEVADTIRQHYLPKALGDEMPTQTIAYVLSIADKLDTLIGCFGMGLEPTGSEDPYGLKRCANGIIVNIIQKKWLLSLEGLICKGIELFQGRLKIESDRLTTKLKNYLKLRFEECCPENFTKDIIQAVIQSDFDDIYLADKKITVLWQIRNEDYFKKACKVAERTTNILKGAKDEIGPVDSSRFCEPLERELWKIYEDNKTRIEESIKQSRYENATRFYGEAFFNIINEFFDKVLVNVEDEIIRRNRLGVMKAIRDIYVKDAADLSQIKYTTEGYDESGNKVKGF